MKSYTVITPVLKDGKRYEPGLPVELDAKTAAKKLAAGAVAEIAGQAARPEPSPKSEPTPPPEKPLSKMNKGELLKVAAAEGVDLPEDASNKAIVAAIEAARAKKAG